MASTLSAPLQAPNQRMTGPAVSAANPMRSMAVFMLLVFLFVAQARILEVVWLPGMGMILALLALFAAVLSGDMLGAMRSKPGMLLVLFTGWMCLCVPFSMWPGGSFGLLKDMWVKNELLFFMTVAVLTTAIDCRKAFYVMAAATATMAALTFRYATLDSGRLAFGAGTLANPNDFATYLLIGAPFCVYVLSRSNRVMQVFWLSVVAVLLMDILKTGSRSALIAIAVITIYLFFKARLVVKVALFLALIAAAASAPFVLPASVVERYTTLFTSRGNSDDNSRQSEFAASSAHGRFELFKRSVLLTLRNPLFGVGPGMFPVAVADESKDKGDRLGWYQTHNLYTQVSSEAGIPGLLLYAAALVVGFRNLGYVIRNTRVTNPDLARMAFWLRVSWMAFLITGCFGSVAYHLNVIFLLALSESLRTATAHQLSGSGVVRSGMPARNVARSAVVVR